MRDVPLNVTLVASGSEPAGLLAQKTQTIKKNRSMPRLRFVFSYIDVPISRTNCSNASKSPPHHVVVYTPFGYLSQLVIQASNSLGLIW